MQVTPVNRWYHEVKGCGTPTDAGGGKGSVKIAEGSHTCGPAETDLQVLLFVTLCLCDRK